MTARRFACLPFFCALVLVLAGCSGSKTNTPEDQAAALKPFIGRWDLTVKSPSRELPTWIEVSEDQGKPKVVMVGVTDHATPLKQVEMKDQELDFLSPKAEEGYQQDTLFKAKVSGDGLAGTATLPDGTAWEWTANRAPALPAPATPKWGKPVHLFDGKDFKGWHFTNPDHATNWKVEHGLMVVRGGGSEIVTDSKFNDFKLHVEFNLAAKSNSGVFLRGRYEVQVETDSVAEPPSHHTGGVYGFLDPVPEQPRVADKWQTFDITLLGRNVTVVHNGVTVIDNKEIPGITGGALDSHEDQPGPIYLQGSESGKVCYRNIVLTPAE